MLFGTWELAYAVWLDRQNIAWSRPTDRFVYYFEGKQRFYTPDFYLPTEDTFIEVKGFAVDKDRAKWAQFEKPLRILQQADLLSLGVLVKDQRSIFVDPTLIAGIDPIAKK